MSSAPQPLVARYVSGDTAKALAHRVRLASHADVRSHEFGALVGGRVTFALAAGDYWLVLLREGREQRAFSCAVNAQSATQPRVFHLAD